MASLTVAPGSIPTPTPLLRYFHRLDYRDQKSSNPAILFVNYPRLKALPGCFIPSSSSQNKGVINTTVVTGDPEFRKVERLVGIDWLGVKE
jgi:hypothetical protein